MKRLAASVVLAARQNGYSAQESKQAVVRCMQRYRESMQQFALMNHLDVWYFHLDLEGILAMARVKENKKALLRASERASKRTRIETFPKLAEVVDGQYRIKDEPPLIYHYDRLHPGKDDLDTDEWKAMVKDYVMSLPEERRVIIFRYRSLDVAQKVVGVGSVGTRCAIVLAFCTDPEYASVFYSSQTTPFYPQRGIAFSCIFDYSRSYEENPKGEAGCTRV